MKLHSDTLTTGTISEALKAAKDAGLVDRQVVFSVLEERGSRTRKNGFEVRLVWLGEKTKGDGRRYTNGGNTGGGTGDYGAFYDEWGWFIVELYRIDPDLVFGHYKTLDGFHEMTRYAFS